MEENNIMLAVLAELKAIRTEMDSMRGEMNGMHSEMNGMRGEMNSMRAEMNAMHATINSIDKRVEHLEAGQLAIRRDVSKLDKKIDILSLDSAQALEILANAADDELSKLKSAK